MSWLDTRPGEPVCLLQARSECWLSPLGPNPDFFSHCLKTIALLLDMFGLGGYTFLDVLVHVLYVHVDSRDQHQVLPRVCSI